MGNRTLSKQEKKNSLRARNASYDKGQIRIENILNAAKEVFVQEGYNKFTLRQIALKAGITVGNLNYYYKTKDSLFRDLLDMILQAYLDEFDRVIKASGESPRERFISIINYLIQDLNNPQTTRFFPELWALANHNKYAAKLMEQMYVEERRVIYELISDVNPNLDEQRKKEITLYISCSIEGMTMFVGSEKTHESMLEAMKKTACESFMSLLN